MEHLTIAGIQRVGERSGYKVVGEPRDEERDWVREQVVPLGKKDQYQVIVSLWTFARDPQELPVRATSHRVGALQAIAVHTHHPDVFDPAGYMNRFLEGTSVDTVTPEDLKRVIARAGLKLLGYSSIYKQAWDDQRKSDDVYDTRLYVEDGKDHELDVVLLTYDRAVKLPTRVYQGTEVVTDPDRVLIVTSDDGPTKARDIVRALLDNRSP